MFDVSDSFSGGHFSTTVFLVVDSPDVQDVVAPNQHFAQVSRQSSVDVLFRICQLAVRREVDIPEINSRNPSISIKSLRSIMGFSISSALEISIHGTLWPPTDPPPIYLEIHVSVNRDEITFVFHAPFEFDHHGFSGETVEERFRVKRHKRLSRHFRIEVFLLWKLGEILTIWKINNIRECKRH